MTSRTSEPKDGVGSLPAPEDFSLVLGGPLFQLLRRAHLSDDTGSTTDVHNGIFHVYGGDRVRISSTEGPATLTEEKWYKVRLDGREQKALIRPRCSSVSVC